MDLTSPGRVLGNRYELVEPLARGGMATVWVADDPVLSRRVAVKVLRADLAEDDATRARFRNEAIAAARLNHPNIVATFDTGDDDGTAYIVMELVEGINLRNLVDRFGGLPVADVVRIGRQVADALDAAHRAGLVHRDVKPANVLVPSTPGDAERDGVPQGAVKVTDFGIAKAAGVAELTRTGMVMGTARYLAPEQVNGRTADARTDVYALGLLLYELCCGHPPFGGDTDIATAMARLTTTPPSIRAERPDVPRALDDVVHRCLARDPAQRFASAAAVGQALALVADGRAARPATAPARSARPPAPTGTRPPGPPAGIVAAPRSTTRRRRRRASWLWALMVLVVAVAAGVGAYLVVRDRTDSGSGAAGGSAAGLPPASQATVTATDFDPLGDGSEDPSGVANVLDGRPDTWWSTDQYQDFSALKAGVGLRFDLDPESSVDAVTVTTRQSGWSAAIYTSTETSGLDSLGGWGEPVVSGAELGEQHRFTIDPARGARAVLVWFTALPRIGTQQQLDVIEVRFG